MSWVAWCEREVKTEHNGKEVTELLIESYWLDYYIVA